MMMKGKRDRILSQASWANLTQLTTFEIEASSIAIFTLDLRQVDTYGGLFDYGVGWRLNLMFIPENDADGNTYNVYFNDWIPQPTGYFFSIEDGFTFTFNAEKNGTIKLTTQILSRDFMLEKIGFLNITDYKIVKPYRQEYGTNKAWWALLYKPTYMGSDEQNAVSIILVTKKSLKSDSQSTYSQSNKTSVTLLISNHPSLYQVLTLTRAILIDISQILQQLGKEFCLLKIFMEKLRILMGIIGNFRLWIFCKILIL